MLLVTLDYIHTYVYRGSGVITLARCLVCLSLQVLNLLLDMPGGFAEVLLEHACLPRILQLVELQLVRQAFEEGYAVGEAHEHVYTVVLLSPTPVERASPRHDSTYVVRRFLVPGARSIVPLRVRRGCSVSTGPRFPRRDFSGRLACCRGAIRGSVARLFKTFFLLFFPRPCFFSQ